MNTIKLLTFDLDDTLWPVEPVIAAANRVQYQWLSEHLAGFTARFAPQELLEFVHQHSVAHPELAEFVSRKRLHLLRRVAEACGLQDTDAEHLAENAFAAFLEARHQVTFFPGVLDTLAALSKQYTLCALSNGNADIFQTAAGQYFTAAISAESCGHAKPDARIFRQALQTCGMRASQTVHIGDHERTDVHGALEAGLHAIWLNETAQDWPIEGSSPTVEIRQFDQLPAALEELNRRFQ